MDFILLGWVLETEVFRVLHRYERNFLLHLWVKLGQRQLPYRAVLRLVWFGIDLLHLCCLGQILSWCLTRKPSLESLYVIRMHLISVNSVMYLIKVVRIIHIHDSRPRVTPLSWRFQNLLKTGRLSRYLLPLLLQNLC